MTPPAPEFDPSRRREWAAIAVFTAIGAVIRLWDVGRLGLVHFDEGIYALAGLWIQSPSGPAGLSPEVIPYAPPGYPLLVGLSYLVLGPCDLAAILPSLAAGLATIPVFGWLGRRTFGPGAGAAASALIALGGPHIAFSRMALTDATFLLAWLVAIGLGMRFLDRPGFVRAVAFGLAVGVAQNVKYNGTLAGVAVASATIPGLMRADRGQSIRAIVWGLLAVIVAAAVYWPWYRFVEANGGYDALLRHHRGYLGGLDRWPDHWRVQAAQAVALSGRVWERLGLGVVAWPLSWLGASFARRSWRLAGPSPRPWLLGMFVGMTVLGGFPNVSWWLALTTLPVLVQSQSPAVRVVAAWWLIMAILTPFYHPYARLMLPLQAACWLVAAGVATWGVSEAARANGREARTFRLLTLRGGVVLAVASSVVLTPESRPWAGLLAPSDELEREVERMVSRSAKASSPPTALRVLARPSVLFYLALRSEKPIGRESGVESLARPGLPGAWAVVDLDLVEPSEREALQRVVERSWRPAVPALFLTNIPTRLDRSPREALGSGPHETSDFATGIEAPSRLIFYQPRR